LLDLVLRALPSLLPCRGNYGWNFQVRYHLTAKGNAREAIYRDDVDRELFLVLLGREIEQQGWQCYAYCLMDNRYHLLRESERTGVRL
jgi:hypothetical protein